MSPRIGVQLACGLLGTAIVTGCAGVPAVPHHGAGHHRAGRATLPPPQPVTRAAARHCPEMIPSHYPHVASGAGGAFPTKPSTAVIVGLGPPGAFVYGNGRLWVTLAVSGVIVADAGMVNPDGSIDWKFPWWRMVAGHLTITGRRLDAPAPPLKSRVPSGYGNIGFQASGVTFPSEGCWQVTGKVADTSLTFVTFVITKAHRALSSSSG
jgi:hypothetical protein